MTKIAIISDTHFGVRGDSPVFLDHQEIFFSDIFFPALDKENIKIVFDLGDTFDRRKYINFVTLSRVKKFFFDELQKRNIEYHAIVGNHSVYYTNTNEINSMDLLLQEYSNFHLYINEPKELVFDSTRIALIPWMTKDNSEVCMDTINESSADYLMGHFSIKGFEMMKGSICDHGLDSRVFSRFEGVYSGHFHHPSSYGNIKYLGAQYEMNWSDHGERRGFHIFDAKKRSLEFVENPNKIFFKIDYDDTDMTVDDIAQLDLNMLKNTYVKIIVKNRSNSYIYDLFMARLNDSGAADVKAIEDSLNLSSAGFDDILDETKDTKDILHDYIDSIETTVAKAKIKSVIDKLYMEASSL